MYGYSVNKDFHLRRWLQHIEFGKGQWKDGLLPHLFLQEMGGERL